MNFINNFLNNITMYRLMLYLLLFLVFWASVLSFLHILPFNGVDILLESFFMVLACRIFNAILAKIFKISTNIESAIITGLILSLIIGPVSPFSNPLLTFGAAFFAMASKYILAIRKKHIFNPAAFGVFASAIILNQGASWWVGNSWMIIPTLIGGFLVLKKIKRFELVGTFLLVYVLFQILKFQFSILNFFSSPIFFFALVMLIEPLTSPLIKKWQIIYGILVVVAAFSIQKFLPDIYYNLEASLLFGNIFSYMVSKNFRQALTFKKKEQLTSDVTTFYFEPTRKINFQAGQYLEWTLPHPKPDSRGVRRFFTISSSPTESFLMLTSKFYEKPSTFKQTLKNLKPGSEIIVSDLSGEFTLPTDKTKKLVFIAGGIGITPFRSMTKWLIDREEKRDIILLYSNKTEKDIVFKALFDKAKNLGVRTVYVNTDKQGYIDEKLIKKEIPDWKERMFYISGPEPMVEAFEKMLKNMGIARANIKRDYFPGYTETHTK